jgi:hypothetical protein
MSPGAAPQRNENTILSPWSGDLPPLQFLQRGIEGVRTNRAATAIFRGGLPNPPGNGTALSLLLSRKFPLSFPKSIFRGEVGLQQLSIHNVKQRPNPR